jgi:hypothetical protein
MTAPKRRWPRYSLRTLFVVVLLVGIWLGYYANWQRERHNALEWVNQRAKRGTVMHSHDPKRKLPWTLELMGEKPQEMIWVNVDPESVEDARQIEKIRSLFPEAHVFN